MSKNLDAYMDEIEAKKDEIGRAIALAFCGGNKDRLQPMYKFVKASLDSNKLFIFKTTKTKSVYEKEVETILDNISSYIGQNVNCFFYEPGKHKVAVYMHDDFDRDISKQDKKEILRMFNANKASCERLGITYRRCVDVYREKGLDGCKTLFNIIKEFKKKSFMYDFRCSYNLYKEKESFKTDTKFLATLIRDFDLKSIDELMNLHSQISSFFIDINDLNEEEKRIVLENRESLKKRVKDPTILTNKNKLLSLKNRVEESMNENMVKNCLETSNFREFFDRTGYVFDKNNFIKLVKAYCYVYCVDGYHTITRFNGGRHSMCFYNDRIFKGNSDWQDEVIIHELIHCLEHIDPNDVIRPFDSKCVYLNEALTQYLTVEAQKYINGHIVESNIIEDEYNHVSIYNGLLPMVEVLKNSSLWKDLISCKLENDYTTLEVRLGSDARRISKLFDSAFKKHMFELSVNKDVEIEELVELKKLVKKIEDNHKVYGKKH